MDKSYGFVLFHHHVGYSWPFIFNVSFRISLSMSTQRSLRDSDWDCIGSVNQFQENWYLYNEPSNPWVAYVPLFIFSLIPPNINFRFFHWRGLLNLLLNLLQCTWFIWCYWKWYLSGLPFLFIIEKYLPLFHLLPQICLILL